MKARLIACLAIVLLTGCASSPRSIVALTNNNSNYLATESEQKLIAQSDQVHQEFIKQGLLVSDDTASAYLNSIAEKFRPALQQGPAFHYYILKDANLNAMALPNGNIYVNAGLITRLESEDQLALVLAHETAHVIQRHSYKGKLDRQNTVVAAHITDLLLGGTGIAYVPFALDLASFSREQEKEADLYGLNYLAATDYDLEDGAQIFDKLVVVKYADRSSSVWSSHPELAERKKYTLQKIASLQREQKAPPKKEYYESFRRKIAEAVIQLHMASGQYELAADDVDYEITQQGDAAIWHVYKGDAKRGAAEHPDYAAKEYAWLHDKHPDNNLIKQFEQQSPDNFQDAINEYQNALKLNNKIPTALRGIGLAAYAQGEKEKAKEYLDRYLISSDHASDRRYIENLINRLGQ